MASACNQYLAQRNASPQDYIFWRDQYINQNVPMATPACLLPPRITARVWNNVRLSAGIVISTVSKSHNKNQPKNKTIRIIFRYFSRVTILMESRNSKVAVTLKTTWKRVNGARAQKTVRGNFVARFRRMVLGYAKVIVDVDERKM